MTKPRIETARPSGKGIAEFREAHDKSYIIPKRINEALKKLGDGWEYELQFIKVAGLSLTDCAAYRDQFEEHIVVVGGKNPKRVWCGTKALATKLRQMVV